MAEVYIISIKATSHKYSISLKNTASVANISPNPRLSINIKNKGINEFKIYLVGYTLNINMAPNITIRDMAKIIYEDKMFDKGYMYLGTYTFLIMPLLLRIDFMACLVAREKKEYKSLPVNIYIGKVWSFFPRKLIKTIVNTTVVRIGSRSVHIIPR